MHEQVNDPSRCFLSGFKQYVVDCRNFAAAQKTYHENREKLSGERVKVSGAAPASQQSSSP
jgi:hypothetical protein